MRSRFWKWGPAIIFMIVVLFAPARAAAQIEIQIQTKIKQLAPVLNVFTLSPNKSGARDISKYHPKKGSVCGGLGSGGLASTYWPPFALPVGFDNWKSGGRKRCQEGVSHVFESYLRFDLSSLPSGRTLRQATLKFTEADINIYEKPPGPGNDCKTAIGTLRKIWQDWPSGKRQVSRKDRAMAFDGGAIQAGGNLNSSKSVDITRWVADWLAGRTPNHGFAILGTSYAYKKNNKTCAGQIRNISLKVEFDP